MRRLGRCVCWLVLGGLVGAPRGARAAPEGPKPAPPALAHSGQNGVPTPILLFVDGDDEDDDGVADRSQLVAHRGSREIQWLNAAPASGHRLRSIWGGAVRVLGDRAERS